MNNDNDKVAYVCGSLTELFFELQKLAKKFYSDIAISCEQVTNKRAFVLHEHYDPEKHPDFSPREVKNIFRSTKLVGHSLELFYFFFLTNKQLVLL